MSQSKANKKVHNLIGLMQKNLECSICLDLLNNPVSTKCDHPFCNFCITEFLKTNRSVPCPLCKTPVTKRSLRERPQLSKIVEDVRQLVDAFQKDTGDLFSPSRCPQSMEFSLGSPDQLLTKEQRGTKRKSNSLEKKNVRNVRQSKRRKSDVCEAGDASSDSKTATDSGTPFRDDTSTTILHGNSNASVPAVHEKGDTSAFSRLSDELQGHKSTANHAVNKIVHPKTRQRKEKESATAELLNYLENGSFGANDNYEPSAIEREGKSTVELEGNSGSVEGRKKTLEASPRKADNLFERLSGLSEDSFNDDCGLENCFSLEDIIGDRGIGDRGKKNNKIDNRKKDNNEKEVRMKGDTKKAYKKDNELFNTPEEIGTVQKTYSRKCKNGKKVIMERKVKGWLKDAVYHEGEENSDPKKMEIKSVEEREFSETSEKRDDKGEVYSGNDFMENENQEKDSNFVEFSINNSESRNTATIHKVLQQAESTVTCSEEHSACVNKSTDLIDEKKGKKKTDSSVVSHRIFKSTRNDGVSAECSVTQSKGKLLFKKIKPKKVVDIADHETSDKSGTKEEEKKKEKSSVASDKQKSKVRNIFDLDLNSSGQDSDPYEFKSSQKTPVKITIKKVKAGKAHKEGQIYLEVKKPEEKKFGKSILKKIKRKDDKKGSSCAERKSDVIEILGDKEENPGLKECKNKGGNQRGNKKATLNFKLTQKDFDDMEQMKDKISEAEDYDLITSTQEVKDQIETESVTMMTSSTCQGEEPSSSIVKIGGLGKNDGKEARKKLVSFHEEVILIGEECDTAPLNKNDKSEKFGKKGIQAKKDNSCKTDLESCHEHSGHTGHDNIAIVENNQVVAVPESAPDDLDIAPSMDNDQVVTVPELARYDLEDDIPCSGASSATDDLDIAPSMEDFEEPNLDIQPTEVIEKLNSQESEDPIPRSHESHPKSHDGHVTFPKESSVKVNLNSRQQTESRSKKLDSNIMVQNQSSACKKSPKNGKKLSLSKPTILETVVPDSEIVPETPMINNFPNERNIGKITQINDREKVNELQSEKSNDDRSEKSLNVTVAEVGEKTTSVYVCQNETMDQEDMIADTCETQINDNSTGSTCISNEVDSESVIKSSTCISSAKVKTCAFPRKLKSVKNKKKNAQKISCEQSTEKAFDSPDSETIITSSVQEPTRGSVTENVHTCTQKSESVIEYTQVSSQESVSLLQPQKLFSPSLDSVTSSVTDVSDSTMVEPSEEPVLKKPKRKCFSLSKSPKQDKTMKVHSSDSAEGRRFDKGIISSQTKDGEVNSPDKVIVEDKRDKQDVITLSGESVRESENVPSVKTMKQNKLKRTRNNKKSSPGSSFSTEETRRNKEDYNQVHSQKSSSTRTVVANDENQADYDVVVMETVDTENVVMETGDTADKDEDRLMNCRTSQNDEEEVNAVPETIEMEVMMSCDKQCLNDADTCLEDEIKGDKGEEDLKNENKNRTNQIMEENGITTKALDTDKVQKEDTKMEKCEVENVRPSRNSQEELTSTLLSNRTIRKREKLERSHQESPDDIFMMDSEYPANGSESEVMVEQNQEGLLDLLAIDSESERVSQASQRSMDVGLKNSERDEDGVTRSQHIEKQVPGRPSEQENAKIGTNKGQISKDGMKCAEESVDKEEMCDDDSMPDIASQESPVKQKSGRRIKRGLAAKLYKELNLSQPNKETTSEEENIHLVEKTRPRDASPTFNSSPHKASQNCSQRMSSQRHSKQNKPAETSDLTEKSDDENEELNYEYEKIGCMEEDVMDINEEVEEKKEDVIDFEEDGGPCLNTEVDIIPDSVQDEAEVGRMSRKFITPVKLTSPKISPVTNSHPSNSSNKEGIDVEKECSQPRKITQVKSGEVKGSKSRKREASTVKIKSKRGVSTTTSSPSSSPLPDVFGTSCKGSQDEDFDSNDDNDDDFEEEDDPVLIKRNTSDLDDINHLDEDDSDSTQMPQSEKLSRGSGKQDQQKGGIKRIEEENDDLLDDSKDERSEDDSSDFVLLSEKEEEDIANDLRNVSDDDEDDIVPSKTRKRGKRVLDSEGSEGHSVIEVENTNDRMIDDNDERIDDNGDVIIVDDEKQKNNGREFVSLEKHRLEKFEERQSHLEERKGVDEDDNVDDSDDDVVVVRKTKSQVIDDSESDVTDCSQETSSSRQGNLTSSSAFSSQSDILSTEDQAKLAENLESMRREIARVEANLAAASHQSLNLSRGEYVSQSSGSKTKNNPDTSREGVDQVEICVETPMKVNETVVGEEEEEKIADYNSDGDSSDDLFLSPPPPTPPPSDEEQGPFELDLPESVKETDKFLQQFRSDKKISSKPATQDIINFSTPLKPLTQDAVKLSTPSHVYHSTPKNGRIISPFSSQNKARVMSPLTQNYKRSPLEFVSSQRHSCSISVSENNKRFPSPLLTKRGLSQGVSERIPLSPLTINNSQSQLTQDRQPRKVFAATSLLLPQMREMQKLLQERGCQFSPKFNSDVTHLIVKTDPQGSRVCERTLKFFQAVAQGCWVLDYQYIQDCKSAGRMLSEERYEILGDTVTGDRHYGPRKSRQSKERDLLEDFQFVIIGESRGLQQDDLKALITECGGSVVSHPDQIPSDYHRLVVTCTDMDGDDEDTETRSSQEFKVINRLYRLHRMITVSREWLLDSLTLYEVQPIQEYVLTNVKGMTLPKL